MYFTPIAPLQDLPHSIFDNSVLIFNPASGATHLFDEYALAVLAASSIDNMSHESLVDKVLALAEDPKDQVTINHIVSVINALANVGLLIPSMPKLSN